MRIGSGEKEEGREEGGRREGVRKREEREIWYGADTEAWNDTGQVRGREGEGVKGEGGKRV